MRRRTKSVIDQHQDWLSQVETEGPFLALPVLADIWPQGVDRLSDADDRLVMFKQAYLQWQRALDHYEASVKTPEAKGAYDAVNRAWIDFVLDELAGWKNVRVPAGDTRLDGISITSPGGEITVRAGGAIEGRGDSLGALLLISEPTTDLRAKSLDGWAATEIDRMSMLLRKARVEVGVVTDGQWWAIVWAKDGKPTGSGMVNALTWAEEPLLRDAFLTLIDQRRFRAKDVEQRLPRLFERSELEAEEITEALGTQVRKSVELLVQAFSESRLQALKRGDPDPLNTPDEVYGAAVQIMMRVVFLLFAEERGMLPTEQLYWDSYAIRDLLEDLQQRATEGEEHLDETYDAWHRLLAVSQALFAGVNYDEMRMPAYGGSLVDPGRFPWLYATDQHGLRLKVSDRVMLHVLESVQTVVVKKERRRISFRDIDVEQIGYIYEGLLGYTCEVVEDDVILGLVGKDGEEPEITLDKFEELYDAALSSKDFAKALVDWVKENQSSATPKTVNAIAKLVDQDVDEAELNRLLTPVAGHDPELLAWLVSWGNLIRRDLRDIPYVIPPGGLVVTETPSRKNSGAHYTPRSLAEEVVKHALDPLVYEPGPLQTNDEDEWQLKSSTAILNLKVADIAAGSGAFLVAAARFLADRVTEAWTEEGTLSSEEEADPSLTNGRAIREVIARCLYGADINPMAVEMCKLSLWLVSMDKTKPFSFVDDKIFVGNSLLGVTDLDQLRQLHIYPDPERGTDLLHQLVDVDGKLAEATRLRKELASPVDEHNPMRSTRGKLALLEQAKRATADLRLIADGIVAAGLPLGGKPGTKLDDAYKVMSWELSEAFAGDGSQRDRSKIEKRIDAGLMPTVETDYGRWRPLHWVLNAPDVFVERGGFDAVIGNPPFLGGKKVSGAVGSNMREWFVNVVAGGVKGNADLVSYFFLRSTSLLQRTGSLGLIATNSVAQGGNREVGIDQMVDVGLTITRATRSAPWPSKTTSLEYAALWGSLAAVGEAVARFCDGLPTLRISPYLEPEGRAVGAPLSLVENRARAFVGSNINCVDEFTMSPEQARDWIDAEPELASVVRPFLSGRDDINGNPALLPARWIVDFTGLDGVTIRQHVRAYEWLDRRVRPARAKLKNKPKLQRDWWLYERPGMALREALSRVGQVLVLVSTSRTIMPVRVSSNYVFSHGTVVFITSSFADQAVLSSGLHQLWAIKYGSGMKDDPRYTPSDVFETFPRPAPNDRLNAIGKALDEERREIMLRRQLGLTALYNLVNDSDFQGDLDVDRMREIHVEIDEATMAAYGWDDVPLDHGFHTYRQIERWTVSPAARVEILDRLLELNHERVRTEGQDVPEQRGELF